MLAFHAIFGTYGFWLPNDPRGSWSSWVGSWELFLVAGPATKVSAPLSLAHQPHDHSARLLAKKSLTRPAVSFSGIQARAVGRGLAAACQEGGYHVLACSILPEHIHLVVAADGRSPQRVVAHMKRCAARRLQEEGIHPFADFSSSGATPPSCWARGSWRVFLDKPDDVWRSIHYVESNPPREGKRKQYWPFVEPYCDA